MKTQIIYIRSNAFGIFVSLDINVLTKELLVRFRHLPFCPALSCPSFSPLLSRSSCRGRPRPMITNVVGRQRGRWEGGVGHETAAIISAMVMITRRTGSKRPASLRPPNW